MAKLKRKEESSRVHKISKVKRTGTKPVPVDQPFLGKEFWQASIAQLRSQEFESIDQARSAFVTEVVRRLGLGGGVSPRDRAVFDFPV